VPEPRRFPPPWSVEETDACFIVRDANRQALAYVYFEEEAGRRAACAGRGQSELVVQRQDYNRYLRHYQ
jgi:hypothetical protein